MASGYLNSPEYLQWKYQQEAAMQQQPLYSPFATIAKALQGGLATYGAKKSQAEYDAKQAKNASLLASLLQKQPVDQVASTPSLINDTGGAEYQARKDTGAYDQPTSQMPDNSQILAGLLGSGNQDAIAQYAPQFAQMQIEANQPPSQYQLAQLAQQKAQNVESGRRFDIQQIGESERDLQSTLDRSNARTQQAEQFRKQQELQRELGGAMSPEEFEQQRQLRGITANAAASNVFGRGMEGRAYNILAEGLKNPAARSTPEYATAWQILSNPKVDPSTGTVVTPDLSAFAPPEKGVAAPGPQDQAAPPQARMPNITAFAPPNPSQAESASAGFATRLEQANKIFDDPGVIGAGKSFKETSLSKVPFAGNYLVNKEYQSFDQASRNFINAQLRRESGAVISPSEFADARKQYLPAPGDSDEVLAQKKANRDLIVKNMTLSAGNVMLPAGVMQQVTPPKGAQTLPMSQGFGDSMPQASQPRIRTYNPQTGQLE